MNSHPSSFFHKHKELFEFAKYVGSEDSISNGTKSFLDQYRECEAQQTTALAMTPEMGFMLSTTTINPTNSVAFSLSPSFAIAPCGAISSSKLQMRASKDPYSFPTSHSSIVQWQQLESPRNSYLASLQDLNMTEVARVGNSKQVQNLHQASNTALPRLPSPVRHQAQQQNEPFAFPKLSAMLIDHSTRDAVSQHTRLDTTQKIELLTGSKCLGRISSESNNLPPSIRNRLHASSNVHHRREKLYRLLSRDYAKLADLHTR